jgi:hypothetical protein
MSKLIMVAFIRTVSSTGCFNHPRLAHRDAARGVHAALRGGGSRRSNPVSGLLDRHAVSPLAITEVLLVAGQPDDNPPYSPFNCTRDMTKKIILAIAMACVAVWIVLLVRMLAANLAAG